MPGKTIWRDVLGAFTLALSWENCTIQENEEITFYKKKISFDFFSPGCKKNWTPSWWRIFVFWALVFVCFCLYIFFTLSLLVCGIVDSSQCRRGDLERKEVKQFVKLSCQPLHGGIRPTAKMNKLFQMHGNQRENNTIFWSKIFLFLVTWLLSF